MKAHTYYIIFGRPPIGGEASPLPPGGATDRYGGDSRKMAAGFPMCRERKCADATGTVPVPWAGRFQC